MNSKELWEMDENFIFRVACHLNSKERSQDVLALFCIAESKNFSFAGARLRGVQYMRGDALLELGKYDEAIIVYNNIISFDPSHVAYNNLALALWNNKEFADALKNYIMSISLNERDPFSLRGAGEILNRLKRPEEAIPYLVAAVNINPNYLLALRALGLAYFNSGYWEGAHRTFNRVLSLDPDDEIATNGLAMLDKG